MSIEEGTELVGSVFSFPQSLRIGGTVFPIEICTGFSVDTRYRGVALALIQRLRREIVEMTEGQHRLGLVSEEEVQQVTLRMLGRDALPQIVRLSPAEIVKVRERAGVSQPVLAGFLNVGVQTVSQWERGMRRPTGMALKLLHVVKAKGIEALR